MANFNSQNQIQIDHEDFLKINSIKNEVSSTLRSSIDFNVVEFGSHNPISVILRIFCFIWEWLWDPACDSILP